MNGMDHMRAKYQENYRAMRESQARDERRSREAREQFARNREEFRRSNPSPPAPARSIPQPRIQQKRKELDADVIFGALIARKLAIHKIEKTELSLWQILSNWVLSRVLYVLFKLATALLFVVGWAVLIAGFFAAIYGLAEAVAFVRYMGWIG